MDANKDPIPECFDSAEEAGQSWDTHSAADYWDEMEEVEMEFDLLETGGLRHSNDKSPR